MDPALSSTNLGRVRDVKTALHLHGAFLSPSSGCLRYCTGDLTRKQSTLQPTAQASSCLTPPDHRRPLWPSAGRLDHFPLAFWILLFQAKFQADKSNSIHLPSSQNFKWEICGSSPPASPFPLISKQFATSYPGGRCPSASLGAVPGSRLHSSVCAELTAGRRSRGCLVHSGLPSEVKVQPPQAPSRSHPPNLSGGLSRGTDSVPHSTLVLSPLPQKVASSNLCRPRLRRDGHNSPVPTFAHQNIRGDGVAGLQVCGR